MLKAAAESFRENPAFDTMELLAQLGTGEAVVSMLDEKGVPGVAQHVWVLPPESYTGLLDDARRDQAVKTSNLYLKYSAAADPDSAFEFLERRKQQQAQQEAAEKAQEQAEKERLAAEKQAAKELEKSRSASAGRWSAACGAWPPPRRARWAASWAAFWAASSVRSAKSWAATWGPASAATCWARCSSAERRRGGCGRGMPLPYMASGHDRPNGIAAATRAAVGRDALIPPGPAARQTPAGGISGLRAAAARRLASETRLRAQ